MRSAYDNEMPVRSAYDVAKLPPGPRHLPLVQTLQWGFRPLDLMDRCARRFGPTFTLRLGGLADVVMVSEPEHIKQVFTADAEVLKAGQGKRVIELLLGPNSLLLLDGKPHLRQRRLLQPPFRGERMQAYTNTIHEVTLASLERWPVGEPFKVLPLLQDITLNVILRAVFGMEEGAAMRHFASLARELFEPPPVLLTFLTFLQRDLPGSPFRKFIKLRDRVDAELHTLIAERRRAPNLTERTDILSLMLGARDEQGQAMTDAELRDELVTMIAAGHETTATTLAWTFDLLLGEPEASARLDEEIRSVLGEGALDPAKVKALEYTEAAIKEALRLRPIFPIVVRAVCAPFSIAGYDLPVGSVVAPCIHLAHRRPATYPDPERFQPQRFLGDVKNDPYAWMPFGGGMRRCLGMAFGLYEARIVLATAWRHLMLRRATPAPAQQVRRGVLMAPENDMMLVASRRALRSLS
jgi:cytochrome P450 family 110